MELVAGGGWQQYKHPLILAPVQLSTACPLTTPVDNISKP